MRDAGGLSCRIARSVFLLISVFDFYTVLLCDELMSLSSLRSISLLGIVKDLVLQIGEALIGDNLEAASEAAAPFAEKREYPLLNVCLHERMDVHGELLYFQVLHKILDFLLELVGEQYRSLHLTLAEA